LKLFLLGMLCAFLFPYLEEFFTCLIELFKSFCSVKININNKKIMSLEEQQTNIIGFSIDTENEYEEDGEDFE